MQKDILVIFDYSGTLSLEAPLYASPENLLRQLEQSGLKTLGVTSPTLFWEEIVNPTWQTGSTTPVGYKQIMQAMIKKLMLKNSTTVDEVMISEAVCRFVDHYLNHSQIDGRWQRILSQLRDAPWARTVIATDHYAEATDAIISYLKNWEIEAIRIKDAFTKTLRNEFFMVANSADLGAHKSDWAFWTSIKDALRTDRFEHIILIDDFGYNEQLEDDYRRQEAVEERKRTTIHLLHEIFPEKVITIPFILEAPPEAAFIMQLPDKEKYYGQLIKKTSFIIESYLTNKMCDD